MAKKVLDGQEMGKIYYWFLSKEKMVFCLYILNLVVFWVFELVTY